MRSERNYLFRSDAPVSSPLAQANSNNSQEIETIVHGSVRDEISKWTIDVRRLKPTIWLPINRAMLGTATFVGSQGREADAAKWTSRLNRTQQFIALAISAAPASFRCNSSRNARNGANVSQSHLRSFAGYERNINADEIRKLRESLYRSNDWEYAKQRCLKDRKRLNSLAQHWFNKCECSGLECKKEIYTLAYTIKINIFNHYI